MADGKTAVADARQQAEQLTYEILTNGIEPDKLTALDALLTRRLAIP